jgi:hypothetical protein
MCSFVHIFSSFLTLLFSFKIQIITLKNEVNNVSPYNVKVKWNQMKQNNSRKEGNEDNFDSWIDIYKPYHSFMKFCGFGWNANTIIFLKIIVTTHPKDIGSISSNS